MNAKLSKIITETVAENNALNKVLATNASDDIFTQVDQQIFRQGMSNLGAAVNVITTQGEAGQAGFTASAVCSVTDTPPTLLVCLNRSASVYETFKRIRCCV